MAHAHHEASIYQPHPHAGFEISQKESSHGLPVDDENSFIITRDNKTPQKPMKLT